MSRLKGDGKAVGLDVDEVALDAVSAPLMMKALDGTLTEASPV